MKIKRIDHSFCERSYYLCQSDQTNIEILRFKTDHLLYGFLILCSEFLGVSELSQFLNRVLGDCKNGSSKPIRMLSAYIQDPLYAQSFIENGFNLHLFGMQNISQTESVIQKKDCLDNWVLSRNVDQINYQALQSLLLRLRKLKYTEDELLKAYMNRDCTYFLSKKTQLIGVISVFNMNQSSAWLSGFLVDQRYQNQGIGRFLITNAMKKSSQSRFFLTTMQNNYGFFFENGFRKKNKHFLVMYQ